jgi:hypothetical protein
MSYSEYNLDYAEELKKVCASKKKYQELIETLQQKVNEADNQIEILVVKAISSVHLKTSCGEAKLSSSDDKKKPSDEMKKSSNFQEKCSFFKTCRRFGCTNTHDDGWTPGISKLNIKCKNEKDGKQCSFEHCVYMHSKK